MPAPPQDDPNAKFLAAMSQLPEHLPQLMLSQPGCIRDGTKFAKQSYIDMQWTRFWLDKPKKMGGYREQVRNMNGVARHLNVYNSGGFCYVHAGSTPAFERYAISLFDGTNTGIVDRTPAGYVASNNTLWQSDNIFQTSGANTYIFAAPTQSLNDITNTTSVQVYYGPTTDTSVLIPAVNTIAAAPAGVAFAQTLAGPGNLVLNVNAPIPVGAGNITVTTNGNLSAVNYTITGTDTSGNPLTVGPAALPNNATASVGASFGTISQVSLTAGTGGLTVSVGWLAGSLAVTTTGGLCVVGPYLFLYGANGNVQWSAPGKPLDFTTAGLAGSSRPVSDKIVKAMPLRGQSAPAIIMWSLSSVIVGNFVGGTTLWNFYTVSTEGSILSQNGIVEHNGVYYWPTTSGFSMFAGTMADIPNEYNQLYFLDNLNFSQRQKCFGFKIPKYKEIWWCFPFGLATECNHAIIFNYEKNYWFDTPLPGGGRSAGYYDVTFHFPIMAGVDINRDISATSTSIWQHEIGLDEVSGTLSTPKAIMAFFQTHEFNLIQPQQVGQTAQTQQLSFALIEPDFNQSGSLTLDVYSRSSARDPVIDSPMGSPFLIPVTPTPPEPDGITFQWTQRLTSFKITSNIAGGDYFAGAPLVHMKPSTSRRTR
jgi:hypothetical protein